MGYNLFTKLEDRFFSKIHKTDSCWLWTGYINKKGYGELGKSKQVPRILAHRAILNLNGIKIQKGMCVDHICRVRHCVNPQHLRVVTIAINNLENSYSVSAKNNQKNFCSKGHPFIGINLKTYIDRDGKKHRICKECLKHRKRPYRLRKTK